MTYSVRPIESWEEVCAVAATDAVTTCIRSGGPNNERAASTWEQHHPDSLRYYASDDPPGYMRLLRLTQAIHQRTQTWAVDFTKPMDYEFIVAVAQVFEHTILVKRLSWPDSKFEMFAANWPVVTAAFPKLNEYPYHLQEPYESVWLVVPKVPVPALSN